MDGGQDFARRRRIGRRIMNGYVLVTGASHGIGKSFAELAAAKGHDLVIVARSGDLLAQMADRLRVAHNVDIVVLTADLADRQATDKMWQDATNGRQIAMLINNAGLGANGPFEDAQYWSRELASIDVNVTALTQLMKLAIPHMKSANTQCRILNIASVASFTPGPGMAVYHATKAYVLSLSEAVATELRDSRISVSALCPGATESNFFTDADMHDVPVTKMLKLPSAADVAKAGWDGAMVGKRVIVPGAMNKVLAFVPRLLPGGLLMRISAKLMTRPQD